MNPSLRRLCQFLRAFLKPAIALPLLTTLARTGYPAPFSEWRFQQDIPIRAPGMVKLSLPIETLDAARANLEDLRLLDPAGNEVPFAVERPVPPVRRIEPAKSFAVSLINNQTVILLESSLPAPLAGLTLTTLDRGFIKAVQVEGSDDRQSWSTLVIGAPVFQNYRGVSQLFIPLPAGPSTWLRITVDDRRSAPVPFTGATIHAASAEIAPSEPLPARITERTESAGETRLTLDLGGAHLTLASLEIETRDPLFLRSIAVASSVLEDNVIREKILVEGTVYRVELEGQPAAAKLSIAVETAAPARYAVLRIQNEDNPPLQISAVRAQRRPVLFTFFARQPGTFALLTGHPTVAAPRYDVARLSPNLKTVSITPGSFTPLQKNPNFRESAVLPDVPVLGMPLDVKDWRSHKHVQIVSSGVQQLELDIDVLCAAHPDFADLRLISEGRQIPYILQHTSLTRTISPSVAVAPDPKKPKWSRWMIQLPSRRLPMTQLTADSKASLFSRTFRLYEEVTDPRGEKLPRDFSRATWTRTPGSQSQPLGIRLDTPPLTDQLFLETDNGDNPPIDLANVQVGYPAVHLLFKSAADVPIDLYYDNPSANAPRYDLTLIAGQVLAAERGLAGLGTRQATGISLRDQIGISSGGGILFWGALTLVVAVLLLIFSRLLSKHPPVSP